MTVKNGQTDDLMSRLTSLCKRRGFVFPSSELYGGLQGFWDWGPLGVELKNNIKKEWWKRFVQMRPDVVGLDSAIITNPKVWKKSGHAGNFADFKSECKKCHHRIKVDEYFHNYNALDPAYSELYAKASKKFEAGNQLLEKNRDEALRLHAEGEVLTEQADELIAKKLDTIVKCPVCGKRDWERPRYFLLMLKTYIGPAASEEDTAFLRPETAQNIFVNFENVVQAVRPKLPFGIAQIGKAFRNEITPGNFIFRSREFEQMELEYFVREKDAAKQFDYWVNESLSFYTDLGINKDRVKLRKQSKEELAHYAKATSDIEYHWPFSGGAGSASGGDKGWAELTGIANRGDFDLKNHGQMFKDESGNFVPWVIEPSFGVERAALAFLIDAYHVVEGGRSTTKESIKEEEVVLRLHKSLAPIKVAVLPLSKKPELQKIAEGIAHDLRSRWMVQYDETASIGKRYRRQDEIGTPYCVTVDFDSIEDKKVTVRDRDTMEQERVGVEELVRVLTVKFDS